MKKVWSFVITGGPCSGKTTAISTIEQELSNRGYYVLTVPETATELISTGIRPFGNSLEAVPFQYFVANKQLQKEELYRKAANMIPFEKVVLIHDRGIIDGKCYISSEEFSKMLNYFNLTEVEARDRYDAVFHLVTAANGAEAFYTLENNSSRTETPDLARKLDSSGIASWTGHSHLHIIDNSTDFQGKITRLMNGIYSTLGIPVLSEVDKKYLIKKPDLKKLSTYVHYTAVDIVQSYLRSDNNVELRLRQRGQNGSFSYYLTEKRDNRNGLKRTEIERRISEREYLFYLTRIEPGLMPIIKKRICFAYENQYFRIDIFDFSEEMAIMEIDVPADESSIIIPSFIDIVKDVTGDLRYRNHNLCQNRTL